MAGQPLISGYVRVSIKLIQYVPRPLNLKAYAISTGQLQPYYGSFIILTNLIIYVYKTFRLPLLFDQMSGLLPHITRLIQRDRILLPDHTSILVNQSRYRC